MIEVVAVMFVITALAIVAVPVGRNVLTQYREREFMEALVEEWEMLKCGQELNHQVAICM
ncbi:type II secretory pathway/competence component/Competence protein ComGC [Lacticaseibacillus rhamnosus MTCC 5462]|nr:type II secretory pathway/competence component/Competence protein ComGC [Lacticaseibacillus rhamnosus MTCC 5462]